MKTKYHGNSKRLQAAVILFLIAPFGILSSGAGADVVVPNDFATVEGDSNSNAPFGRTAAGRYQQVYGAGSFDTTPGYITEIRLRPDSDFGSAFSMTTHSAVQVYLSTTTAAVDGLNPNFDSNLGADNTLVISGPLSYSSAFTGPAGGPKDFDVVLSFTTPFLYNPANGNLLMDVRYPNGMRASGPFFTTFDAVNAGDDDVSLLLMDTGTAFPEMAIAQTSGLVTHFSITPVPEPTGAAGIALAVCTLPLRRRRSPASAPMP
jgi:hypothetical protein